MSELDHLWRRLSNTPTNSLLKQYFTINTLLALSTKRTSFGGTINDCIRVGCQYPNTTIGIFACDPDAYTTFADIFEPIIKKYHKVSSLSHPTPDYGDATLVHKRFNRLEQYVISSNINVNRNLEGYRFPSFLTLGDRREIEKQVVEILINLEGDLMGQYFPYVGMTEEARNILTDVNIYFDKSNRLKKAAGCYDDWCVGRGVFYSLKKNLACWINEEDHIRIFCTEKGNRLTDCYILVTRLLVILEKKVTHATGTCGYLNFCVSNLGTAMYMSVLVKLPRDELKEETLEACTKYQLDCKRIQEMPPHWVWEIINRRLIGVTEFEALNSLNHGVCSILTIEYTQRKKKQSDVVT
ncbi:arginine kinase Oct f 2-like [Argonauta hians]